MTYRSPRFARIVLPALAAAALAYAAYATHAMRPRIAPQPPLAPPPTRPFAPALAASGIVEPSSELVPIASRAGGAGAGGGGWIARVHVKAGDHVRAGDPLFDLDATTADAEIAARDAAVAAAQARVQRLRALPRPEDVPIANAAVAEARALLEDAQRDVQLVESLADPRAVSDEERGRRARVADAARARLAQRQAQLDLLRAGPWNADLLVANADLASAQAAADRARADREVLTTRAPFDAVVYKVSARPGQHAPAAVAPVVDDALVVLGAPPPLNIRVDINEEDAPRLNPAAPAQAFPRGDASRPLALTLLRIEPLAIPKRDLSGRPSERVDTRVVQAIYQITDPHDHLRPGQRVDVYIQE
jgi:multidrug efflux pump subunit AcrA (membrane-fusion protein)